VSGNEAAKRSKVPPCLRRSGFAQAGVKFFQHTQLPFETFFMKLVGWVNLLTIDGRPEAVEPDWLLHKSV